MNWVKGKKWKEGTTPYYLWMGNEIYKKKIGFVGFGAVARNIARLLQGFDVEIVYCDPFVKDVEKYQKVGLEEIFSNSDYVTVHLPVNKNTKGMVDEHLLNPTVSLLILHEVQWWIMMCCTNLYHQKRFVVRSWMY